MNTHSTLHPQMNKAESAGPSWQSADWLEPRLVVLTGVMIVLSLVSARLGAAPLVVLGFNVVSYVAGGFFGAKSALASLRERRIDVDMLMILAALGAASIDQWHEGAVLLLLFSLSNVLQDYAIGRSRQAIRSLLRLYPEEAKVQRGEQTEIIPASAVTPGDVILIEPGARIPADGHIIRGHSSINEASITGESMPVEKHVGDMVFAGTLNQQGALDVVASQAGDNTTLARIIRMVEEAQDSKAPTERFLERFEQVYATFIIVAVVLFITVPPLLGLVGDFRAHFYLAMVLMTVASPCALVISTPAAFISAIAAAARQGVLFKGGAYIEQMAAIRVIAFDKTGTLTEGQPQVTDIVSCCELGEDHLLAVAAAVEQRSEHPLAQAIVTAGLERGVHIMDVECFESVTGMGVVSQVDGRQVRLGSVSFLEKSNPLPVWLAERYEQLERSGKTVVGVVRAGQCEDCGQCSTPHPDYDWMGVIALADQIRREAPAVIAQLRRSGIERIVMLTGDNQRVAETIAAQAGLNPATDVYAGLLPEGKVQIIRELQASVGPVMMVGDGVNDAPGLAMASIGMAMGAAGTDVALETADVVLMGDRLQLIGYAVWLSRLARRVVWQNLSFSLLVIAVLVVSALFFQLSLPLGVLGHEGSTVIVVLNGLVTLLLWPALRSRRSKVV